MRILFLLCITFGLFACTESTTDGVLPIKKKYRDLRVIYTTEVCCSNMQLLDDVKIQSQDGGYENDLLAAVNFEEFAGEVSFGDTLTVDFTYSDEDFYCQMICNRHSGIKVKIENWK
ncbi:MAG: hypothetical protein R3B93_03535 [Bacteroidia bacterium]